MTSRESIIRGVKMKPHIDQHKSLETVAVLALASLVVGLLFSFVFFLYLSLGLLVIGIFCKKIATIIASYWMKFAFALGVINSKILLSIVFFLFLLPISIVYRIIKGDTLGIKRQNSITYWKEVNRSYLPEDFEKQW